MENNKLNQIKVGKNRIFEERKLREEQELRRRRRIENEKRRKRQKVKAVFTLIILLIVISAGMTTIVYLLKDNKPIEKGNETNVLDNNKGIVVSENSYVSSLNFSSKDYVFDCSKEILDEVAKKAKNNDTIKFIYENYKAYPEHILKSVSVNNELVDFAIKYPVEVKKTHERITSVDDIYKKGEVPLFIQWDDRWGYYRYGDDVIGTSGCGPTCLSMVVVAITGRTQYTPTAIADFAMENNYYYNGAGTTWTLFSEGVKKLGLKVRTLGLSEQSMSTAIKNEEYLILSMGPGIFTKEGHYIVIYDYKDGKFAVKDPNSEIRSNTTYSFDEISSQIKNIWAISK